MTLYRVGSHLFSNLQDASIYEHIYNATIELAGGREGFRYVRAAFVDDPKDMAEIKNFMNGGKL